MNTKQMDCALEISHTLNFSRAAENLYISQPTLSYQIDCLEEEIGFRLFVRSGKGAELTPAGEQFCNNIQHVRDEINSAVEQGKNFHNKYSEILNIALPMRTVMRKLPEIIHRCAEVMPKVALNVTYTYGEDRIDEFLRGKYDMIFGVEQSFLKLPNIKKYNLYNSPIYCVTRSDDLLAAKSEVTTADFEGRTMLVSRNIPPELTEVQNHVLKEAKVYVIDSMNHEATLTNISAGVGIGLIPGYSDDQSKEFVWIPFSCKEKISCVLAYRKDDNREMIKSFLNVVREYYGAHTVQ